MKYLDLIQSCHKAKVHISPSCDFTMALSGSTAHKTLLEIDKTVSTKLVTKFQLVFTVTCERLQGYARDAFSVRYSEHFLSSKYSKRFQIRDVRIIGLSFAQS